MLGFDVDFFPPRWDGKSGRSCAPFGRNLDTARTRSQGAGDGTSQGTAGWDIILLESTTQFARRC